MTCGSNGCNGSLNCNEWRIYMKTVHKGYDITFSETFERWDCQDLKLSHEKLGKLKTKIDTALRKELRKSSVTCLAVERGWLTTSTVVSATITDIKSDFKKGDGREYSRNKDDKEIVVWYSSVKSGRNRPSRDSTPLAKLYPNTSEAREAIAYAQGMSNAVRDAKAVEEAAWEAIPRMSAKDIEELLKLHRSEKDSEEDE